MGENSIRFDQPPAVFQKYKNECLVDLRDEVCRPYLDDVLVYSPTFDRCLKDFHLVLQRLKAKGINIKPSKCGIFRKEVRYLGCIVSRDGYRVDPTKKKRQCHNFVTRFHRLLVNYADYLDS